MMIERQSFPFKNGLHNSGVVENVFWVYPNFTEISRSPVMRTKNFPNRNLWWILKDPPKKQGPWCDWVSKLILTHYLGLNWKQTQKEKTGGKKTPLGGISHETVVKFICSALYNQNHDWKRLSTPKFLVLHLRCCKCIKNYLVSGNLAGCFQNRGTPKWVVYNGNPIKMDDLGSYITRWWFFHQPIWKIKNALVL